MMNEAFGKQTHQTTLNVMDLLISGQQFLVNRGILNETTVSSPPHLVLHKTTLKTNQHNILLG